MAADLVTKAGIRRSPVIYGVRRAEATFAARSSHSCEPRSARLRRQNASAPTHGWTPMARAQPLRRQPAIVAPKQDDEPPRARLALLLERFSELSDDREPQRIMYPWRRCCCR